MFKRYLKMFFGKGTEERDVDYDYYEVDYNVQERVPVEYQAFMWQMVEFFRNSREGSDMHEFQFSSSTDYKGRITQKIVHNYIRMEYSKVYEFPTEKLRLDAVVYVYENDEKCRMFMRE